LSDEPPQFQILAWRSFHRFLGLRAADPVADPNTSREFRAKLTKAERVGELFTVFNARLADQGFLTRKGQIMEASFGAVPRQRNRREETAAIQKPGPTTPPPAQGARSRFSASRSSRTAARRARADRC